MPLTVDRPAYLLPPNHVNTTINYGYFPKYFISEGIGCQNIRKEESWIGISFVSHPVIHNIKPNRIPKDIARNCLILFSFLSKT